MRARLGGLIAELVGRRICWPIGRWALACGVNLKMDGWLDVLLDEFEFAGQS